MELKPIGRVIEGHAKTDDAPRQSRLEAGRAVIEIEPGPAPGLEGLAPGQWIWVLMWFHLADRDRLKVHPRGDASRPMSGVFNTRSPSRPNPIGLDLTRIVEVDGPRLVVEGLDAVVGTPVVDIKPHIGDLDSP